MGWSRRTGRAAIAGLLVVLVTATAAHATHAWGGYHWARTSSSFTLRLGDNVSAAWDARLATTSADWSQSAVLDTLVVTGGASPRTCKPRSGRVEVCNERYGKNGWLGVAQVWVSGAHITQGTVKVNDTYFNTAKYNTAAWRNFVMCQEVGHTFGLDHQDENFSNAPLGSCMDYTSDPTPNQHPNQHDYDQLAAIYAHLDSGTTVAGTSSSTGAGDAPPQWGKLVDGNPGRGVATYRRDLGGGASVFTFVVWA